MLTPRAPRRPSQSPRSGRRTAYLFPELLHPLLLRRRWFFAARRDNIIVSRMPPGSSFTIVREWPVSMSLTSFRACFDIYEPRRSPALTVTQPLPHLRAFSYRGFFRLSSAWIIVSKSCQSCLNFAMLSSPRPRGRFGPSASSPVWLVFSHFRTDIRQLREHGLLQIQERIRADAAARQCCSRGFCRAALPPPTRTCNVLSCPNKASSSASMPPLTFFFWLWAWFSLARLRL